MGPLFRFLARSPDLWTAYVFVVVLLPPPAFLFAGFNAYLRGRLPYPASAIGASVAMTLVLLAVTALFWLVVGELGLSIPPG